MLRRYAFRYILLICSILVSFVLMEGILNLADMLNSSTAKYLQKNNNPNDLQIPDQLVKDNKIQKDTFNIYYFGESTMEGAPFKNIIPQLIEGMLSAHVDGKELRWINMAQSGMDFEDTEKKIYLILQHKDIFHPSLIVIYSGHNEFLKYHDGWGFTFSKTYPSYINMLVSKSNVVRAIAEIFKIYKLEIDDRAFFDTPLFPLEEYDGVIHTYTQKMSNTLALLKESNIPVIISTQVANYADWEPNRSVFCKNESDRSEFQNHMQEGLESEQGNDINNALVAYKNALLLCNTFAETYFRLGKIYQHLGFVDDAWTSYRNAVDLDRMPMRALSSQNNFIRSLSREKIVYVVDAEEYLRKNAEDGLIGYNLMIDGHHPNLKGYLLLAELFTSAIQKIYPSARFETFSEPETKKLITPTTNDYDSALLDRAEWLIRLSTWTYNPDRRLNKAEEYIDQSLTDNVIDARQYLGKMTIKYIKKDIHNIDKYYEKAKQIDPVAAKEWNQNPWIQQIKYRALN